MAYAEVFVNITARTLNRPFTYSIPDGWPIEAGCRVLVPFGPRLVEGFVLAVTEQPNLTAGSELDAPEAMIKSIHEVLDDQPWFDAAMLATAKQLAEYYLCPLAETLRLFIPGKNGVKAKRGYQVSSLPEEEQEKKLALFTENERQFFSYIAAKRFVTAKELVKVPGYQAVLVKRLIAANLVESHVVTAKTAKQQTEKQVAICQNNAVESLTFDWSRRPAQKKLFDLLQEGCLLWPQLKAAGVAWDTVKRLAETGLISITEVPKFRSSYREAAVSVPSPSQAPRYTFEQQTALEQIIPALDAKMAKTFLLHGVTGSGKTEVYLAAAAAARKGGRQVIMLVPEIALTGQIVSRFQARFGDDVVVIHSKLSLGERFDSFYQMREKRVGIVIGARSALFAPAPDLGLIILDEEHEFTYKQEEVPRYHARTAALLRARASGAVVILGSATPALESYYEAQQGNYQLLSMDKRVDDLPMPKVHLVSMTEELKAGRRTVISPELATLLTDTVERGEQAIVLINRRGFSTFVLCRECGHVIRCPHCEISLVYHAVERELRCHYCQKSQPVPDVCPACGSRYIKYFGTGTQKVEQELHELLPNGRIIRMDQDTTSQKFAHDRILRDFSQGKYDILLGTQMVAKGHDIHNVTAVGVISADTALNLPDFRAAERTFALITQAAGRAGRGEKTGTVVVQTYNPEHYALVHAAQHDYDGFYREEIEFRRQLRYPPFCRIIKIAWQGGCEEELRAKAEADCRTLRQALAAEKSQAEVIGPVPAAVAKIQDVYRVIALIKAADPADVRQVIRKSGLTVRRDVFIDVDPVSLMY